MKMRSLLTKQIPIWIQIPMVIGILAYLVWNDLYPISAHPDLRFQVLGEILELLTLIADLAFLHLAFASSRKRATGGNVGYAAYVGYGIAYSIIFIVIDWRKFFPGDHFQFSAGTRMIIGALFSGILFGLLGSAFNWNLEKPSKENERSVV